jgi:hypothetical protein
MASVNSGCPPTVPVKLSRTTTILMGVRKSVPFKQRYSRSEPRYLGAWQIKPGSWAAAASHDLREPYSGTNAPAHGDLRKARLHLREQILKI